MGVVLILCYFKVQNKAKKEDFTLILSFELPNNGTVVSIRKMKMKMAIRVIINLNVE